MTFHAPPLTMPSGGVFAYGRDPDGNVVELLQPPK
jgi:predicted enzyme related to lactoylglutathione lyase